MNRKFKKSTLEKYYKQMIEIMGCSYNYDETMEPIKFGESVEEEEKKEEDLIDVKRMSKLLNKLRVNCDWEDLLLVS